MVYDKKEVSVGFSHPRVHRCGGPYQLSVQVVRPLAHQLPALLVLFCIKLSACVYHFKGQELETHLRPTRGTRADLSRPAP